MEELEFQKTKFSLELAQSQLFVLENLTQPRIHKTKKDELLNGPFPRAGSCRMSWKLEKTREDKIHQQIAACRILAPIGGKFNLERPDPRGLVARQRSSRGNYPPSRTRWPNSKSLFRSRKPVTRRQ